MSAFSDAAFDGHEAVHFVHDTASGLKAIIAVHSTRLGPAAGGCRMWPYATDADALHDALRLSRGMSYKNAMAGLPLGGGKAVIIGDARRDKTEALFEAFGDAVDSLGGQYITAEDVGITTADMSIASRRTRYVSGLPKTSATAAGGDPSPLTAHGVFVGIRAAVRRKLQREDMEGLKVAVQGLGGVGYNLCRELHAAGARLWVADINKDSVARAAEELDATPVDPSQILFQDVDVIAPCALGAVLNVNSIDGIRARIVAGAANNQLQVDADGERLHARGILYAPDYVINAGGIINVAAEYLGTMTQDDVHAKVAQIEHTLDEIFAQAESQQQPTNFVADSLARQKLA